MILHWRPIKVWPEGWPNQRSTSSPFKATYKSTLELLDRELEMLTARDITLQVDTSERNVRADGQLRGDAKVNYRGVILSFHARKLDRQLTYACDAFHAGYYTGRQDDWQHNLRAVALGLEALRKVERYGIGSRGQQYQGYAEIGSGIALGPAPMSLHQASIILAEGTGLLQMDGGDLMLGPDRPDVAAVKIAYIQAAKLHHPDRGGDVETFKRIVQAYELLMGAA